MVIPRSKSHSFIPVLQHVLFAFVFPTGQRTDCSLARYVWLGTAVGRDDKKPMGRGIPAWERAKELSCKGIGWFCKGVA